MERKLLKLGNMRIAIIGLGLMGGSLAFALRSLCKSIVGVDTNEDVLLYAMSEGIIDQKYDRIENALDAVDLVILATPVREIINTINWLSENIQQSILLMDLGSTKVEILSAMNKLPEHYEAIGGHPICGKEKSTIQYADPGLYRNANFILVKSSRTTSRMRIVAEEIVDVLGSIPVWMTANLHDRYIAATSNFPYLLSNLLSNSLPKLAGDVVGPGFLGMTRLSASSIEMMMDIVITNRVNILERISEFSDQLTEVKGLLENKNYVDLESILRNGKLNYLEVVEKSHKVN